MLTNASWLGRIAAQKPPYPNWWTLAMPGLVVQVPAVRETRCQPWHAVPLSRGER